MGVRLGFTQEREMVCVCEGGASREKREGLSVWLAG